MTIFLIGYMASGKTTFGRALARRIGYQFIDLDFYIEQRFRKSVSELFAIHGEEWFRERERDLLREIGEIDHAIIACGGGTPCFFDNMDWMNAHGLTVCLEATDECTVRRIILGRRKRPLAADKSPEELMEFVRAHKSSRAPFYNRARITFPSDQLESSSMIRNSVNRFLAQIPALLENDNTGITG